MPHFFATRRDGDRVEILGPDARHLAGPLRARAGETIAVVDPAGFLLTVRLESVSPRAVTGSVVATRPHHPEPRLRVTMALALLPAAALEHSLSRCTELGAHAFVLVAADRSVARAAKPERWATICREAAMLAGRLVVPEVRGPVGLAALLAELPHVVVLESTAERRLGELPALPAATLAIGPEGGWSPAEKALAGDRTASLGARNLRADTAAVAALAAILSAAADL
jgi:16S rRNA (uracil1498-N3)-methyltransferase